MARVVALIPDLFFGSKVKETLTAAGHDVQIVSTLDDAAAAACDLAIVDLQTEGLDSREATRRLGELPLLGFYSHVDTGIRDEAMHAGFDLVVPRSRMAREMPDLVTKVLSG